MCMSIDFTLALGTIRFILIADFYIGYVIAFYRVNQSQAIKNDCIFILMCGKIVKTI